MPHNQVQHNAALPLGQPTRCFGCPCARRYEIMNLKVLSLLLAIPSTAFASDGGVGLFMIYIFVAPIFPAMFLTMSIHYLLTGKTKKILALIVGVLSLVIASSFLFQAVGNSGLWEVLVWLITFPFNLPQGERVINAFYYFISVAPIVSVLIFLARWRVSHNQANQAGTR